MWVHINFVFLCVILNVTSIKAASMSGNYQNYKLDSPGIIESVAQAESPDNVPTVTEASMEKSVNTAPICCNPCESKKKNGRISRDVLKMMFAAGLIGLLVAHCFILQKLNELIVKAVTEHLQVTVGYGILALGVDLLLFIQVVCLIWSI